MIFKLLGVLILLISAFLMVSYLNHRIQLSREETLFSQAIGTSVEVNGHLMNVYSEGRGEKTLVFLSGGGTSSPVLDFKSLYAKLSHQYKIVVIEKAGYGFSEISDHTPRDLKTLVSESRQALALLELEGPYVLCPHSMSGLEALYWAQHDPSEVEAIIGLDMALPPIYDDLPINLALAHVISFMAKLGVTRWFPSFAESDAIKYGTLSAHEQQLSRAIFYRRTQTSDMVNEIAAVKTNAKLINEHDLPPIPMLLFTSNGTNTGFDFAKWRDYYTTFIKYHPQAVLIKLDAPHYVHAIEYETIAKKINDFFIS